MLWRLLKAVAVGSLGGPLLVFLWLAAVPALTMGIGEFFAGIHSAPDYVVLCVQAMILAYVFALPLVLVLAVTIGVPTERLMRYRRWRAGWSLTLAGGVSGLTLGLLWHLVAPSVWWLDLSLILSSALAGAATALVWWRGEPAPPLGSPGE